MPNYNYECGSCENVFDDFRTIATRHNVICPKCGGKVEMLLGIAAIRTFKPHYSKALGKWVGSKREETRIAHSMGLEEVGDMHVEDVESEARRAKRQEDEKRDRSGAPEEFYRAYDRVKVRDV